MKLPSQVRVWWGQEGIASRLCAPFFVQAKEPCRHPLELMIHGLSSLATQVTGQVRHSVRCNRDCL